MVVSNRDISNKILQLQQCHTLAASISQVRAYAYDDPLRAAEDSPACVRQLGEVLNCCNNIKTLELISWFSGLLTNCSMIPRLDRLNRLRVVWEDNKRRGSLEELRYIFASAPNLQQFHVNGLEYEPTNPMQTTVRSLCCGFGYFDRECFNSLIKVCPYLEVFRYLMTRDWADREAYPLWFDTGSMITRLGSVKNTLQTLQFCIQDDNIENLADYMRLRNGLVKWSVNLQEFAALQALAIDLVLLNNYSPADTTNKEDRHAGQWLTSLLPPGIRCLLVREPPEGSLATLSGTDMKKYLRRKALAPNAYVALRHLAMSAANRFPELSYIHWPMIGDDAERAELTESFAQAGVIIAFGPCDSRFPDC